MISGGQVMSSPVVIKLDHHQPGARVYRPELKRTPRRALTRRDESQPFTASCVAVNHLETIPDCHQDEPKSTLSPSVRVEFTSCHTRALAGMCARTLGSVEVPLCRGRAAHLRHIITFWRASAWRTRRSSRVGFKAAQLDLCGTPPRRTSLGGVQGDDSRRANPSGRRERAKELSHTPEDDCGHGKREPDFTCRRRGCLVAAGADWNTSPSRRSPARTPPARSRREKLISTNLAEVAFARPDGTS
ncbi:Hypothetical predicted protein [Olea europaea subsp. europaea]|uniref:Uncharacterized protein n=1 Tax=Olea europaea subsp. europaea TaxID=158383 RepID=A0A8S0TNR9_OLEEU|nr:Hypothetical predicted protein [Olea europaea subsp. europaea]